MAIVLYIPFFLVQCFFNYSNAISRNNENCLVSFNKQAAPKNILPAVTSKKTSSKQTNINLNKRFQPGKIAFCNNIDYNKTPIPLLVSSQLHGYGQNFHFFFFCNLHALRGPPSYC